MDRKKQKNNILGNRIKKSKNRTIDDTLIACTDNLTEFDTAVNATFPKTEIQNCTIHLLRNFSKSKYASYKDLNPLMEDLETVYSAVDEDIPLKLWIFSLRNVTKNIQNISVMEN